MPEPRDRVMRKADLLAALTAPAADVWVATASADATPYLVPLSLAWIDECAVIALDAASPTARNIGRSRVARLGVGPTRDVALIDVCGPGGLGSAGSRGVCLPRAASDEDPGVARVERARRAPADARRRVAHMRCIYSGLAF